MMPVKLNVKGLGLFADFIASGVRLFAAAVENAPGETASTLRSIAAGVQAGPRLMSMFGMFLPMSFPAPQVARPVDMPFPGVDEATGKLVNEDQPLDPSSALFRRVGLGLGDDEDVSEGDDCRPTAPIGKVNVRRARKSKARRARK